MKTKMGKAVILLKEDPSFSPTELSLKQWLESIVALWPKGVGGTLLDFHRFGSSKGVHEVPKVVKEVLTQHQQVFRLMTELPPSHDIDHAIQLILGASLVNVYPYWYTHILKNEIERLVQEMLVKKNKKWRIEVLRRLPCSQQSYSPGLVSHFGDR